MEGKCPYCGSENVEHMTRVTGFFSKIEGWNQGKLGELRDRYRDGLKKIEPKEQRKTQTGNYAEKMDLSKMWKHRY